MKTVLLVPGFREDLKSRDYKSVINVIEGKGYTVKFVSINWKRTVIGNWVDELDKVYADHDPSETILAGFSYGAMTAFMTAAKQNPAELWLFSLSPYFSDDMPKVKKSWLNNIGHRRAAAFNELNFNEFAKNIKCKTLLFFGEVEGEKYPLIANRAEIARKTVKNSSIFQVTGSDHDVTDGNYIAAIEKEI